MNRFLPALAAIMAGTVFVVSGAAAEDRTPPPTEAEKEAVYSLAIEKRAAAIVTALALPDPAKAARVHDLIIAQYRALRARDDAAAAKLKEAKGSAAAEKEAQAAAQAQTKTLHEQFLTKLAADLTPEQVEKVKDKMTYDKVKVTFDAYCVIVPGLTDADKAKILELLKQAREEAIDGGSANEKSLIFQKHKDRINDYLNAHGHDVAKAYRDWNAKQEQAKKEASAKSAVTQ